MKKRIGWLFVLPLLVNVSFQQDSFGFSSIKSKQDYLNNKLIFDFEDDGAHRSSGNNSYTSTNTYNENNSEISLTYADSVPTGSPLNGEANILGRIAKNTTNAPVILIKDIDVSGYTFSSLEFKTKGVAAMGMAVEYKAGSFNGSGAWTSIGTIANMPTQSTDTDKSFDNLGIVEDILSLRFTVSVTSSTSGNRDFQIDDVTLNFEEISKEKTITLSSKKLYTKVGSDLDITAKSLNYDVAPTLTWASSDETVATVSNGVLTPLSYGKTTIKATDTDNSVESNALEITVYPNNDTDISIATALAVCGLTGDANSPYEYSTSGLVDTVTDTKKVDIYDGETLDSITAYGINSTLFIADQKIRVTGYLINYKNTTPEFATGCTYQTYHTITYVLGNGDANVVLNDVLSGSTLDKPIDPVRDGYTFDGWFDENDVQWDFDNDTISEDITLTAKWTDETASSIQTAINNIDSYFGLAYRYNDTRVSTTTVLTPTPAGDHNSWDGVVAVSSITSFNLTNDFVDGESAVNSDFTITWNKGTSSNFYFKKGEMRIYNGGSIVITPIDNTKSISKVEITSSGGSASVEYTNDGSATILASSRYDIQGLSIKYGSGRISDVGFRIKAATDDMNGLATAYPAMTEYGIEITQGSTVKKYNYMSYANLYSEDNGGDTVQFVVIDLGDALNNRDRLEDEFTFRAYAQYDGNYIYSTSSKTHSIVSLVEAYYANVETKEIVSPLYDLLVEFGYIVA